MRGPSWTASSSSSSPPSSSTSSREWTVAATAAGLEKGRARTRRLAHPLARSHSTSSRRLTHAHAAASTVVVVVVVKSVKEEGEEVLTWTFLFVPTAVTAAGGDAGGRAGGSQARRVGPAVRCQDFFCRGVVEDLAAAGYRSEPGCAHVRTPEGPPVPTRTEGDRERRATQDRIFPAAAATARAAAAAAAATRNAAAAGSTAPTHLANEGGGGGGGGRTISPSTHATRRLPWTSTT
mmetsp:Transcript_75049/g.146902  ORF Transcript_75049/g.146902 Transcript_75049/m.146902 type:complete len:236 (+) Transcript_75049:334-1041(+)